MGRVGGVLQSYWADWAAKGAHGWVVGILREGYKVQFKQLPPLSPQPTNPSGYRDRERNANLSTEIENLVEKGAVEKVSEPGLGYYSRLFLRPKATGGSRPILDLSQLNPFIESPKFHQETLESIRRALKPDHWTFSVDLKDAFFQIPIHKKSRMYLRFLFEEEVYQYKVLPFGMTSSPYVFTRVVNQVKEMLHKSNHQLFQFLDDWLGQAPGQELAAERAAEVVALCRRLGLVLNLDKSELVPQQEFDYVGMHSDLRDFTVSVTDRNVENIREKVTTFLSRDVWQAKEWLSLLGVLQSQCQFMRDGLLHLRPIQFHLKGQWRQATGDLRDPVAISQELRETLTWWLDRASVKKGVPIQPKPHDLQVFTDASTHGWGGYAIPDPQENDYSGTWSKEEQSLHINVLEMRAVTNVLRLHNPPAGYTIMVVSDNATVVAYINHQGGTISFATWLESRELLLLTREKGWSIRSRHIAGALNTRADRLSRKGQILPTEWSLHQDIAKMMFEWWGTPLVDLFATRENTKCLTFVSPHLDRMAIDCDALNISWERRIAYAFPPRAILGKVVAKIRETNELRLILVAPDWPKQTWYPDLLEMSVAGPLPLPTWRTMLKQPQSSLYHTEPEKMCLHAWLVVRGSCGAEDSARRQQTE